MKQLLYVTWGELQFRPSEVLSISDLLSATVNSKKLTIAYKSEQQNTEQSISLDLKGFLQADQEQLLSDMKLIFPASKLE